MSDTAQTVLPRWRGFNITEMLRSDAEIHKKKGIFREEDFKWIADWGFDFVRIWFIIFLFFIFILQFLFTVRAQVLIKTCLTTIDTTF